ncbi:IS110 family transposase [Ramlibacter albus]|uniref:IS110 family transposase n=1 Tax=Ramlibacter albus TaxID=2079448 RepID=A0A923M722_9BURK|nr:IS110 family transposase [Ramlibacter albus]MBC5764545.1 IS110 family transposase [Ramlibacter albus]
MDATALTPVGLDVAKNVFQLHWVEPATGEVRNVRIKRAKLLEHFANRGCCLVAMEACGGAQYWARELIGLGHQVKLLPAKAVKAFVTGNKSDAIDARAIWMALRQGQIKPVAIKSEAQQAVLALHRMRQQLVKVRTMQINELRGLLTEYGEVFARGRAPLARGIAAALERLTARLPQVVLDTLLQQWQRVGQLDEQIGQIERRLQSLYRQDAAAQRIARIPGIGLLTATAASAAMGQASAFRSGREFAAWLGLVPAHTGTGGKTRMLGISKRGDTYLRTLFIHGARSVVTHTKHPDDWLRELLARRPRNVAVVAVANKMARTAWALLRYERDWQPGWPSQRA